MRRAGALEEPATDDGRREAARELVEGLGLIRDAAGVALVASVARILAAHSSYGTRQELVIALRFGLVDLLELSARDLPRSVQRRIGWGPMATVPGALPFISRARIRRPQSKRRTG